LSQSLSCRKCGYEFIPRKTTTRYARQCPKCNSTELDSSSNNSQTQTPQTASITNKSLVNRTNLPKVIYDLVGILDAASPENALVRAFEICRKLSAYKYKYGLESLESVFKFLEEEAQIGNKRGRDAEERLRSMLENPELVFYECGGDLSAVDWYQAWKREGYTKDFLGFLSEAVNGYWTSRGYELRVRENAVA
jgi:DNA-directed RNA polymerase subunit M/transcription elongation factor TFIIS